MPGRLQGHRFWLSLRSALVFIITLSLSMQAYAYPESTLAAQELRQAGAKDEAAALAARLITEAQQLYEQATAESRRRAIEKYEASLPLWRDAGDRNGEADALTRIAEAAHLLSDNHLALARGEQAVQLWRQLGAPAGEAAALNLTGLARWGLNDYQKALEDFDRALALHRATANRRGEASILHSIGIIHAALGELHQALEHYRQALLLWREVGDRAGEARTLTNIGVLHTAFGEYQKALECYDHALPLRRAVGDRVGETYTLNNIGDVYYGVGEYQKALDYYEQALTLGRQTGDRWAQANTLNHMGNVYDALGNYAESLGHYNEALTLHRAIHERRGEANSLGDMASLYQKLGEYRQASDYHDQALSLRREIGDRSGETFSLLNLGFVAAALGDHTKALDFYGQAVTLARAIALPYQAAQALHGMARVERDLGHLNAARTHIEAALDILESLRTRVIAPELRASFLASVRQFYDLQIELLMRLDQQRPAAGHAAAALRISERARARSLLETLAEARAEIRHGIAADLLERERGLQQQINLKAERLARLHADNRNNDPVAAAQKELDGILSAYQQVEAQIRASSPRYAELTQPQPLSLAEIQQQVLDPDTVLLEYSLGEEQSYLWAVTSTAITTFALPKRAEVEGAARRVYGLLATLNQPALNESPAQYRARVIKAEADYAQAAVELSRMLLGPVAAQLGNKRLLIVSEGALQYVPFAALPAPSVASDQWPVASEKPLSNTAPASLRSYKTHSPGQLTTGHRQPATDRTRPLIADHEIVNLPSASVLATLRRETAGRRPAAKALAVFADPVFRNDDSRIKPHAVEVADASNPSTIAANASATTTAPMPVVERSAREAGLDSFVRLRFSRQEAEAISAFAPLRDRLTALDFVASRQTVQSADLSQYRIIHFATHGLMDSQHPELSGVVLSLVDERGRAQDGFLRLHEIYNLKLNAELVVLSACQTALGKEVRGEGLIGLTRGFMYAGASSVMASLWRVDDRATAELMKRFYEGMLKAGLRPAAALRAAQVSMLNEARWAQPHYWAAFTLQGEWR